MGPHKKNAHACVDVGKLDYVRMLRKGIPALYLAPLKKGGYYIFTDGSRPYHCKSGCCLGVVSLTCGYVTPVGVCFPLLVPRRWLSSLRQAGPWQQPRWVPADSLFSIRVWDERPQRRNREELRIGNQKLWCPSVIECHIFSIQDSRHLHNSLHFFYLISNCLFETQSLATLDTFSFL